MAERALSASMLAAIASGSLRPFLLYEGEYVSGGAAAFLRLFTGVGTLSWDGKSWTGGRDLLSISPIRESTSLEAIGFSVRLSGMPADKLSLFLQSMRKNRAGKLWLGFMGDEVVESGTAQAGAASTLTLAAGASSAVNAHARKTLRLASGAGSVQSRTVAAYDGGTKVATVSPGWRTNALTKSSAIDHANWTKQNGITITANYGAAPDGTMKADRVQTDGISLARYFQTVSGYAGKTVCFALKMRSLTGVNQNIALHLRETGFGTTYATQVKVVTPAWQMFSISAAIPGGSAGVMALVYDSSGVLVWDFLACEHQWNEGATPGEFIETDAAAITLPDATTGYEVIDPNGVIADPYPLRRGRFDIAPISRDPASGTITIEAKYEGPLARLMVPNVRHYTHEDQQLRLAGDKGFDQVEELQDTQDLWGPEVPAVTRVDRPAQNDDRA